MPGTIFLCVLLEQQSRNIFIAFPTLGASETFTKMLLPRVRPQSTARAEKQALIVDVPSNVSLTYTRNKGVGFWPNSTYWELPHAKTFIYKGSLLPEKSR